MIAVIALGGAFALAVGVGVRVVRKLRARITSLESRTDAAQRWQDEVRQALATSKGR